MPNPYTPKSKNIAVFFGDEKFPKPGKGYSSKKFRKALGIVANVLNELDVRYVYLPCYKGANLIVAEILSRLEIPYTLVIAHPSFGSLSSNRQKHQIVEASSKADKTIMLGEDTGPDVMFDVEAAKEDLIEYVTRHCNSIIIAHDDKPTEKFKKLLKEFDEEAFDKRFNFIY